MLAYMAIYLRLTLKDGKPVLVNMDNVSCVLESGGNSRLYFLSGEDEDKIDVGEDLAEIARRLEAVQNAQRS